MYTVLDNTLIKETISVIIDIPCYDYNETC